MRAKIFWKIFEPSFPSLCACACPTYSLWVINTQQKPFWISFGPWCPLRCFNLLGCMSFLRLRANAFECPNLFLFTSVCRKQTVGDVPTSWYVPCMFVLFCSCPGSQNKRETMSVKYVWNSTVNMSHNFNSQVTFGSRWLVCPARFSHPFSYSLLCRHRKLLILRSWRQSALPFCNNRCPTTPPTGSCSLKEL